MLHWYLVLWVWSPEESSSLEIRICISKKKKKELASHQNKGFKVHGNWYIPIRLWGDKRALAKPWKLPAFLRSGGKEGDKKGEWKWDRRKPEELQKQRKEFFKKWEKGCLAEWWLLRSWIWWGQKWPWNLATRERSVTLTSWKWWQPKPVLSR